MNSRREVINDLFPGFPVTMSTTQCNPSYVIDGERVHYSKVE